MLRQVITCDHCGKDVPNTYEGNFALTLCNAAGGNGDKDYLHGCSREHLGFAVAAAFGIPIDGSLVTKLDAAAATMEKLGGRCRELEARLAHEESRIPAMVAALDQKQAQIVALQEQLAGTAPPPNVDGKTPGQVAYEAYVAGVSWHKDAPPWSEMGDVVSVQEAWEAGARAVLSAFAPDPTQAVRAALGRVRERVGEISEETNGFRSDPLIDKALALAIIDDELSTLPAANLTGPKKPTKPLIEHAHEVGSCSHCDSNQCTDCKGSGYLR